MKTKIAIFASGSGSNAQNIIQYFDDKPNVDVALILTNRSDAGVIERVSSFDIPCEVIATPHWKRGDAILEVLKNYEISFIVLAGFLLRIPDVLLHNYPNKIINIHPSLLPKYGGKGMYGMHVHEAVVTAKESQTGITIHYINEHYDEGAIILQASCPIFPMDTPIVVAERVHRLEFMHYPKVIEQILSV